MTIEEFRTLKPGDKVVIVSEWEDPVNGWQNHAGKMDRWLGRVMTIRSIGEAFAFMTEDQEERNGVGWSWAPSLIAGRYSQTIKPSTEADISNFLGF